MRKCKAFLFDMDGVLLDTEKIYVRCWIDAAQYFGYELKREEALNLRSLDSVLAEEYITGLFGTTDSYSLLRKKRKELMAQVISKDGIQVKEGAVEILRYLRLKRIPAVVVTSSDQERAEKSLKTAGLLDKLERVVSVTDVERGKPFPYVYSHACEILGIKPAESIVVEDSPNGIMSAHEAGCRVVMIPDLSEPDEKLKSIIDYQYNNLSDMMLLLE